MNVNARILAAAAAPWNVNWIRQPRKTQPQTGDHTTEDSLGNRKHLDITSPLSLSEPQSYGSTSQTGEGLGLGISTPRVDSLVSVPEEDDGQGSLDEEEEDAYGEDWELETQGLYRGSYIQLVALYTLVPLSSLLAFVLLALLPLAYPRPTPDLYPHPRYFPFPLPEILASASLWSLSHLLRIPLHTLFSTITPWTIPSILLSTFCHSLVHNILRLSSFPLLLVRQYMSHIYPTSLDPSFRRVWWIALGWSFAEITVGVAQGYEQIALYRDVLVPPGKDKEFLEHRCQRSPARFTILPSEEPGRITDSPITITRGDTKGKNIGPPGDSRQITETSNNGETVQQRFRSYNAIASQVDHDLDRLMSFRGREELEEVYGIPVINIPVFVSCLLRINSIILSLGLTLLLSASYLRSCPFPEKGSEYRPSWKAFYITCPVVVILHFFLSFLHTPLVLPRIGVHTAAYVGLLVALGCFFAGLGMWEALT